MASSEYNNPELTAVLKTLSAFAPAVPAVSRNPFTTGGGRNNTLISRNNVQPQRSSTSSSSTRRDQEEYYEPSDCKLLPPSSQDTTDTIATSHAHAHASMVSRPLPLSRGSLGAAKPAAKDSAFKDPSLIITWPAALKYVMKTVTQNESVQAKIRRMIQSQHDHEKKWWQGRVALMEKQATRAEKKKRIDEVLRSVGAPVDATTTKNELPSAEENERELKHYDAKVYKTSVDLAKAVDSELRSLNIPFFAIKHSLVVVVATTTTTTTTLTEKDEKNPKSETVALAVAAEKKDTISKDELLVLQRRMLELLENLCKEE
ncbi:hypothetical protein Egran_03067 [Elaphomyces granulatus]|uniref:Uncharacterized protein n=1 Tax=Elaphomyces granulatus TaxID=519963 RepID=A0A232LYC6_9EURO|nr:hypothetical protein Egran_03067 [Elaphomyces granulatus]